MISNENYKAIAALDFSAIKLKLTHLTFGEGWSQAKAEAVENEYRRFLYLAFLFPEEQAAPTPDVDTFWHYHILDTMKYAADCEQVFGYFLHHYPYLGLMEGDDPQLEIEAGNRTRELYEATFGEPYFPAADELADEGASLAAKCQFVCTVAAPKAAHSAKCQFVCTVAKPKAAQSAKCQFVCTVARPKAAQSAKCQFVCTVAKPRAAQSAKCQFVCTVAKSKPAQSAKCQFVCTVARPGAAQGKAQDPASAGAADRVALRQENLADA